MTCYTYYQCFVPERDVRMCRYVASLLMLAVGLLCPDAKADLQVLICSGRRDNASITWRWMTRTTTCYPTACSWASRRTTSLAMTILETVECEA